EAAEATLRACAVWLPRWAHRGVILGASLGTLAEQGRDNVRIIGPPRIASLGAWLEQLLAESTGKAHPVKKEGMGLIPVDGEKVGPPDVYGKDRLFVYERLTSAPAKEQDNAVAALEKAGHPVVRINLADPRDAGQEMFRWEIATAVAGSILGINPFNQPDVEDAKVAARNLMAEYTKQGKLPAETAVVEDGAIKLFTDPRNADAIATAAGGAKGALAYLKGH